MNQIESRANDDVEVDAETKWVLNLSDFDGLMPTYLPAACKLILADIVFLGRLHTQCPVVHWLRPFFFILILFNQFYIVNNVDSSGIRSQNVRVEGDHADHTTTTAADEKVSYSSNSLKEWC